MKMSNKYLLLFVVIGLISACHKFDENTLFLHHPQAVLEHGVWEIQSYTINGEEHLGKIYRYTFYMYQGGYDVGNAIPRLPGIKYKSADMRVPYNFYYQSRRIGGIAVGLGYPHNAPQKYPVFTGGGVPDKRSWKIIKLTPKQLKIKMRDSLNNEHIAILKKKIF